MFVVLLLQMISLEVPVSYKAPDIQVPLMSSETLHSKQLSITCLGPLSNPVPG